MLEERTGFATLPKNLILTLNHNLDPQFPRAARDFESPIGAACL
jgi:hypothetical protein